MILRCLRWFRRRWKTVVFASLAAALLVVIVLAGLRNSDAARLAVRTAQSNPRLIQRIGEPITVGWFVGGSLDVTPASGTAELAIPLSGPKGDGKLYAYALKTAGIWRLTLLQFGFEKSSDRLDLLK